MSLRLFLSAVLQDDIIDSVEPFADAASLLKERGAYKVYVMVTHGILSGDCVGLIEDSDIDEVISINYIDRLKNKQYANKYNIYCRTTVLFRNYQ